jgi:hypothetical protein
MSTQETKKNAPIQCSRLDGVIMRVASGSKVGEVNSETQLHFEQEDSLVTATHGRGTVQLGCLIGIRNGSGVNVSKRLAPR